MDFMGNVEPHQTDCSTKTSAVPWIAKHLPYVKAYILYMTIREFWTTKKKVLNIN